jgi:hypothetical protein
MRLVEIEHALRLTGRPPERKAIVVYRIQTPRIPTSSGVANGDVQKKA